MFIDMNKFIFSFLLLLLFVPKIALSQEQIIALKDGSQIKGNLTGVANGIYSIHTQTMGDLKINVSQVASISYMSGFPVQSAPDPTTNSTAPTTEADNALNQQIQATQTKLISDPALMNKVQAMMQNPELMRSLTNPALVQKVMSHDVEAIKNDPEAQKLMNSKELKDLMESMSNK